MKLIMWIEKLKPLFGKQPIPDDMDTITGELLLYSDSQFREPHNTMCALGIFYAPKHPNIHIEWHLGKPGYLVYEVDNLPGQRVARVTSFNLLRNLEG